ncbi:4Fe-4S dicluster domain-containing protein [Candidatus Epulonipiscium viviparus]|uniref:4Fe-4S dicluster domain-containing protein n=1 Tax=Candidatus Epulonipiscium viviparus TaxID=420336 RepID=UPI0027380D1D|nr:4Fe-4S dicluster domain-containing protein [Candidatus Epulopiscium viviparus]
MRRIKIDRSKCIGCLTCVTACIISHDSLDARNRVVIDTNQTYSPIFCRHCTEPECVYTCMTGAMHKDNVTKFVEYEKDHCASCYMCIMACPYGVLKSDDITHQEIMKCDMCTHRVNGPMCVEKCPMQAITLQEVFG